MGDRDDAILVHLQYLRQGQDAMNAHLAMLNGRVGTNEKAIAVLQDRAEEAKLDARKSGALAGGIGAFLTGCAVFLYEHFSGK